MSWSLFITLLGSPESVYRPDSHNVSRKHSTSDFTRVTHSTVLEPSVSKDHMLNDIPSP